MKKITFLLLNFCFIIGYSQCPAGSQGQFPTSTVSAASDNAVVGISGCNYTGEFTVVDNIIPGSDYEVTISGGAYITVVEAANTSNVLAHGVSPVSFTAPVGVTEININWTDDAACNETSSCFSTTIQCTSCAGTPPAANDEPGGAIPITPSASGTGCASFTFSYTASGTSDSGNDNSCLGTDVGLDRFYTWTSTTDALIWNDGSGDPGITIWDSTGTTEIDCSGTFASADTVLSGWTIGQDLLIQIYDFDGSTSDISFCLEEFSLPPAPNCAETPISPTDGATGVIVGTPVTVTWTAPSSGPTPTSYDFYAGVESDGSDLTLVTNVASETADITFNFYSTTYYWQVIPKNGDSEASGCPLWSFTTEDFAGSTPTTLQTITINSCGDMQTATNAYDASVDGIQWIELVYSGGCEDIVIDTDSTTGFTDTELGIYDSNGNLVASDDDGGSGTLSLMTLTNLEAGTYFIAAGAWNVTYAPGYGASSSSTTAAGSMVIDFVSGATLSNDEFNKTQFTYYPNPTKDKLHFNSVETIDEIAVYNLLGQEVLRQSPRSIDPELDLSNLRSGNYFLKIRIENRIETIKIIKD
ncbi:T9SS type A sorting domain-containing protein [Winogradskyella sp. A3E31]|uniref:T9SS type A sorting domain-containing protein n=1 Tax=Winogradskyella sp. A3E31 TaxID=3349637 RepID=UPI00398B40A8